MIKSRLHSLTAVLPPVSVTSDEIERRLEPLYSRLKLPQGRLEVMTGIRERRIWHEGTLPSDAAVQAGEKLFSETDFPKSKIGAVIFCSVCRDFLEPASATGVHARLGLPETCQVFDLSNACLGIFSGMITAESLIAAGNADAVLLVSGEVSNAVMNGTIDHLNTDLSLDRRSIKPMFASLTLGSGACALLLTREDLAPNGHQILGHATLARTQYNELCRGNALSGSAAAADTLMQTDSELLMHRGIETAADTWMLLKSKLGWGNETPRHLVSHQVGSTHQRLLLETLGIDPAIDFSTFEYLGNTGSAAAPTALALAAESVLKSGDRVALFGIGSGINCTMFGLEW